MTGWADRLLAAPAAGALALVLTCGPAAAEPSGTPDPADPGASAAPGRVVLTWQDRRITESSGLVVRPGVVFTVNDSGDGPVVYAVDPATGGTRTATTYSSGGVTDVEALAPGSHGSLWVGDIGDNNHDRTTVSLYHLTGMARLPGHVDATRYDLVYPDGQHDAETLLVDPLGGRLLVVTKTPLGGTVYAAPADLRAGTVNRLHAVASVPGLLTDGSFLPDGRHVLLRTYTTATLYTYPGWRAVRTVELPPQEQGEGLAVAPDGAVYISTEGAYSAVQRVDLDLGRPTASRQAVPTSSSASPPGPSRGAPASLSTGDGRGAWIAGGGVLAVFLGWLAFTASRPRGRRTR